MARAATAIERLIVLILVFAIRADYRDGCKIPLQKPYPTTNLDINEKYRGPPRSGIRLEREEGEHDAGNEVVILAESGGDGIECDV
jgi:hypothetical protein